VRSADPACADIASSLEHYSRPLANLLADASITELCLQRPGEVLLERANGWSCEPAAWATAAWARHFARLVATATEQRVNADAPLLSATLPTGERVQIVLPPATWPDRVAIAIRRPSGRDWSLDELSNGGLFSDCRAATNVATAEQEMLGNILVSGATGSGKTTLTKALIREIPEDERLISIEDAAELRFERHVNVVRLFYSKDGQGLARVTPKQLLEASLRLRPDRILLAELRGEEAYYFLRNVSSGHPGSITSVHAGSAMLAFEQLALLVKESAAGREIALGDIHRLLRQVVDVVVQCERSSGGRRVQEVWWRDAAGA
jgi:type IV secretion system protein VirB11